MSECEQISALLLTLEERQADGTRSIMLREAHSALRQASSLPLFKRHLEQHGKTCQEMSVTHPSTNFTSLSQADFLITEKGHLFPASGKFVVPPVVVQASEAILAVELQNSGGVPLDWTGFQRGKGYFEELCAFVCAACDACIPTGSHSHTRDPTCRSALAEYTSICLDLQGAQRSKTTNTAIIALTAKSGRRHGCPPSKSYYLLLLIYIYCRQ